MHVLTVMYGQPTDTAHFDAHYDTTHRPLAAAVPGLRELTVRRCTSLDGSTPPFYLVAQLAFDSHEALTTGLESVRGQAAAADIANFADGGATILVLHD